jgi:hypothetical protein
VVAKPSPTWVVVAAPSIEPAWPIPLSLSFGLIGFSLLLHPASVGRLLGLAALPLSWHRLVSTGDLFLQRKNRLLLAGDPLVKSGNLPRCTKVGG